MYVVCVDVEAAIVCCDVIVAAPLEEESAPAAGVGTMESPGDETGGGIVAVSVGVMVICWVVGLPWASVVDIKVIIRLEGREEGVPVEVVETVVKRAGGIDGDGEVVLGWLVGGADEMELGARDGAGTEGEAGGLDGDGAGAGGCGVSDIAETAGFDAGGLEGTGAGEEFGGAAIEPADIGTVGVFCIVAGVPVGIDCVLDCGFGGPFVTLLFTIKGDAAGATHLVQIVDVDVTNTVETVVVICWVG